MGHIHRSDKRTKMFFSNHKPNDKIMYLIANTSHCPQQEVLCELNYDDLTQVGLDAMPLYYMLLFGTKR